MEKRPRKILIVALSIIFVALLVIVLSNSLSSQESKEEKKSLENIHFLGNPDSEVIITEYSSFTCPFCKRYKEETFSNIKEEYIDTKKVLYIYKHYTRNEIDVLASNASECAGEQDMFFEYIEILYRNQSNLSNLEFESYAKELNLDLNQFNECYSSLRYNQKIIDDRADGVSKGVTGTPGFIINQEIVSGAQPFLVFKEVIDRKLK